MMRADMNELRAVRDRRHEAPTWVGRTKAGKLAPVLGMPVRPGEGGFVSQSITVELDPIAGRMITPIHAEFTAVFVPVQAIDAIKDPAAAYAGMTEVIREKYLSGAPLFPLETEGEITKRLNIVPSAIAGVKKTSEISRLAHNVAVNFLRLRRYEKAAQILHSNTAVTPALLSSTILQRFNAALDPDDHINGAVQLSLPSIQLPVSGLGFVGTPGVYNSGLAARSTDATDDFTTDTLDTGTGAAGQNGLVIRATGASAAAARPQIYAELNAVTAGDVSLADFYNAEKMDRRTRQMAQILKDNPEYGEEMVLRWAHGLSVEPGKVPFVIAEKVAIFGRQIVGATDSAGVAAETMRSDMLVTLEFSVPVPQTELGGYIVSFLQVGLAREMWRAPSEEPGGVLWETGTDRRRSFGVKRCGWH